MIEVLVTGGTGTLGRPTVAGLRAAGHRVRVLSRRPGPGVSVGDLLTGRGVAAGLAGVHTVVHLATSPRGDDRAAAVMADEAARAGVQHLLVMSIVGVDDIPLGYYLRKRAAEQVAERLNVPSTVLRATQFHPLLARLFAVQRRCPILLVPTVPVQPVAVPEVAGRLVELVSAGPSGRVADVGGPEAWEARRFAAQWMRHAGQSRPVVPVRLPGRTFAAYRAGFQLVPGPPWGRQTFLEFLASQAVRLR